MVVLGWALGFAAFMLALPGPAPGPAADTRTDAIVVPTGAPGRIDRGLALLEEHAARRMLVTGTAPGVTRGDLARAFGHARAIACCVDLGGEAVDTRGNGEETARWVASHRYRSLRLVTSDWHARRARLELEEAIGPDVTILVDGVRGQPTLRQALNEYHKLLLRRVVLLWERWR
ncbi:YdcF family protein [Sphingomonas sp. MMS24-JH45]